jgi:hypothetical protein
MINEMKDSEAHNRLQHDPMIEMWETWNLGDDGDAIPDNDNE